MIGHYQDQIKRISRSFNKLPEMFTERVSLRSIDNYYHFFQDCWHLKDWILNDESLNVKKSDLNKYINSCRYLPIVESIACATKHLYIDRTKYNDINTHILKASTAGKKFRIITLKVEDKMYDAKSAAYQSIKEWHTFLQKNNIPSSLSFS